MVKKRLGKQLQPTSWSSRSCLKVLYGNDQILPLSGIVMGIDVIDVKEISCMMEQLQMISKALAI